MFIPPPSIDAARPQRAYNFLMSLFCPSQPHDPYPCNNAPREHAAATPACQERQGEAE